MAVELAVELLPKSLREIAEIVGESNALKLANAFAGQRVTIPKNLTSSHPLSDAIGAEAARDLSWHCGGQQIEIPTCKSLRVAQRNAEIRAARRQGATIAQLVAQYSLCRRAVFLALKQATE